MDTMSIQILPLSPDSEIFLLSCGLLLMIISNNPYRIGNTIKRINLIFMVVFFLIKGMV
jgi:prophage maintenance system killer protein